MRPCAWTRAHARLPVIQTELTALERQLASAVAEAGLSTRSYRLHAVMVHSGEAGSGHYWVYVHDRPSDRWHKFNDVTVTQASLAEVEESSYGGDGVRSAYCVVYVSEDAPGLRTAGPGAGFGSVNVEWSTVDADARQFVEDDNTAFLQEQQAWNQRQALMQTKTDPITTPAPPNRPPPPVPVNPASNPLPTTVLTTPATAETGPIRPSDDAPPPSLPMASAPAWHAPSSSSSSSETRVSNHLGEPPAELLVPDAVPDDCVQPDVQASLSAGAPLYADVRLLRYAPYGPPV
jgi:hypothetical protein